MQPYVQALRELQQILYFLIAFGTTKSFIQIGKHYFRYFKTQIPAQLTA